MAAPTASTRASQLDAALPAGERRQLTVLFCDLVGSTLLSQQLDAEEWRDVIAQYQRAASAAVARFGGHVAKTLGDGLLIYFGWPTAREDDPERAIRAGLAILDAMGSLHTQLANGDGTRLAVRLGLHTGPVVIADGGEVFGETANVAARVQGAADPDSLVITAATQRLVAGMFVVEDRGPQALKGVREPVTLYRVVQPSGVRSRLDVAAGHLTPFVGRQVELATLVDRWERAADGEGQNVLLVGEAGVGKSRLAYQLRERLATVPHTWLECGASPYIEGTPFHPVMALVAQGLAFTATDTAAEKVEKITRGLRDLASSENVALLADFLGLPPPSPLALNPDVQRRKTMELLAQWNLAMSAIQPLVLLVEDLHWCDASSLELLGRIIAQSATARVLFVATARPEFTAPWPARSNLTTIPLARLTKRQAREMVTMLAGETVPAETLEALVARADGVPLYVEELTKAVAEPGAARGAEAIPTTLAGSLMARLDRLSTAKEVAQRAAVLGREFGYPLLAAVAEMDDAGLRQGLARLVDAEIVFQRGEPPDATYTFKHALVQEAAYESLLKRTRQQLHARVADVLGSDAEPEVLARHAQAAGRLDDAIDHYQRAGEEAQARSAHEEAIRDLHHAIEILSSQPASARRNARETSVQLALARSLTPARGFGHPDVEIAYERARSLSDSEGDGRTLGHALMGLAVVAHNSGRVVRAQELATGVLAAAEKSGDGTLVLLGHLELGLVRHFQGDFAPALAHFDAARAACDLDDPRDTVLATPPGIALAYSAWTLWALGFPDRALACARESVALARRLAHPFGLAQSLCIETVVHWLRRDRAAQRELAIETIALSEAQGFPLWLGFGRALQAAAAVDQGEMGAIADVLAGLALAADTGNQAGAPTLFELLGDLYLAAGQLAEARGAVDTGLVVAEQTRQAPSSGGLYHLRGQIVLAEGGPRAEAETCFQRALEDARTRQAKLNELRAATRLACLWLDEGRADDARALLAPVYEWFTEGFDTRDLIEAKALLDELR
jgi:class 3 adenylate cyclase/tetratricopeptide (TPR) repeat protein